MNNYDYEYLDGYEDILEASSILDGAESMSDEAIEKALGLIVERVTMTKELDLNFVVQELSSKFSKLEPVEATVIAEIGVEVRNRMLTYCSYIKEITVKLASGKVIVGDMDEDCDIETIGCKFYPALDEAAMYVRQPEAVQKAIEEYVFIVNESI